MAGRGGSVGGGGGGGEKEKKEASKEKKEASSKEKKEASKEKKIASKDTRRSAADHRKALKKALKDRRRSGLEPPDALYPSGAAFVACARGVALDVRSTRERVADARAKRFETYRVTLCDVEVEYEVDERQREVRVLGAREVEPLERPGETRRESAKESNE